MTIVDRHGGELIEFFENGFKQVGLFTVQNEFKRLSKISGDNLKVPQGYFLIQVLRVVLCIDNQLFSF